MKMVLALVLGLVLAGLSAAASYDVCWPQYVSCSESCCDYAGGTFSEESDGVFCNDISGQVAQYDYCDDACVVGELDCVAPGSSCSSQYASCAGNCGSSSGSCKNACSNDAFDCADEAARNPAPPPATSGGCCGAFILLLAGGMAALLFARRR